MLKLTQNDMTIEVIHRMSLDEEIMDAVVVPATEAQRCNLGTAAVGQAWMAWSPLEATPKVIKFMPPSSVSEEGWRELLKCYRFAIRVADIHEAASLALPLPGEVGLTHIEDALAARLSLTLLKESSERHYLKHLQLVASGHQEAVLYADRLAEEQGVSSP
ncbi:hypothetical protein [Halomonas sp.]|uniref:hypothetical protein n=1 Tax=Halomonas sp. TaxID=1486246 RepID=UPI00298E857C|nr:hypothetical protein [Halomonas sp.]MDW7746339.1 hypothetical protein [Halomonas sp.]